MGVVRVVGVLVVMAHREHVGVRVGVRDVRVVRVMEMRVRVAVRVWRLGLAMGGQYRNRNRGRVGREGGVVHGAQGSRHGVWS